MTLVSGGKLHRIGCALLLAALAGLLAGCPTNNKPAGGTGTPAAGSGGASASADASLSGRITIDGSSTVYPLTQAVAEEFMKLHPKVQIEVAKSGTGGGFKKFVVGEIDINDASRPIDEKEATQAKEKGVEYVGLKVGVDGISVVVNPKNDFLNEISVGQLKKIWEPGSTVKTWSDVNDQWPAKEIKLFGADTDSGTFDFFTEVINGKAKQTRDDYTPSGEDNMLVRGVADNEFALGYIPFSYYVENQDKLKVVPISPSKEDTPPAEGTAITPSLETVQNGTYTPLARPLFIYVSKKSMERPEVKAFIDYYLGEGQKLVKELNFVPLTAEELKASQDSLK